VKLNQLPTHKEQQQKDREYEGDQWRRNKDERTVGADTQPTQQRHRQEQ
jgi:hypothetical protein